MRTAILVLLFTAAGLSSASAGDGRAARPEGNERAVNPTEQEGVRPTEAAPILVRQGYRLSVGPWSVRFALPRAVDLLDLGDRVRAFLGMLLIVGIGVYLSDDRGAISWRLVFCCLALQWVAAVVLLRTAAGGWALGAAGSMLDAAVGGFRLDRAGPETFVVGLVVGPTIVVGSIVCAALHHLGVLPRLVRAVGAVAARLPGAGGAESLDTAASMLVGQTEAPLVIRPYLARMTNSELLTVMAVGMANVSGVTAAAYVAFGIDPRQILISALLSAPGAMLISKLLAPEVGTPETYGGRRPEAVVVDSGLFAAVWRGTREGVRMALLAAAALIAVSGLLAVAELALKLVDGSVEGFLGWALAPAAYMLGVPWEDCRLVGDLLGTRTALNELVAIHDLSHFRGAILDRSFTIAGFALCGFANLGSAAMQVCGLGALAPGRFPDLARLGVKALFAATLANFLSACIAGVLI